MTTTTQPATSETTTTEDAQRGPAADGRHTQGVAPETDYVLEDAVGAVARIGLLWARHGLGIGRSALEASALTLRTTADVLRALSERLEVEPAPREADPADGAAR